MSNTRIPEATRERVQRGLDLYREHSGEIEHLGHGRYTVPGCSGGTYTVDLAPFGGEESCSCPDHKRTRTVCKHITATTIWRAKSRAASRRVERAPEVRSGRHRSQPQPDGGMMRLRLSNAGDTESGEAHDVRNVGEALAIATEGG